MQGEAPGAVIAYNWIHDVIKYGARFDAPINEVGEGKNGTMHHNVIWNAGGLMVKGDYHDIHNNTVFNSSDGKNDIIVLTDGDINNRTPPSIAMPSMRWPTTEVTVSAPIRYPPARTGAIGMATTKATMTCSRLAINNHVPSMTMGPSIVGEGTTTVSWAWGMAVDESNSHSMLILGPPNHHLLGVDDSGAEGWSNNAYSCAVLDNGDLVCWGANEEGQLGLGNTSTNVSVPTVVDVGSGFDDDQCFNRLFSNLCLLSDQSVKCWGKNDDGQLGLEQLSE